MLLNPPARSLYYVNEPKMLSEIRSFMRHITRSLIVKSRFCCCADSQVTSPNSSKVWQKSTLIRFTNCVLNCWPHNSMYDKQTCIKCFFSSVLLSTIYIQIWNSLLFSLYSTGLMALKHTNKDEGTTLNKIETLYSGYTTQKSRYQNNKALLLYADHINTFSLLSKERHYPILLCVDCISPYQKLHTTWKGDIGCEHAKTRWIWVIRDSTNTHTHTSWNSTTSCYMIFHSR